MPKTAYNKHFYEEQQQGSLNSAKAVWPVLFEYFRPASVIDIGCGVGTWLAALNEFHVSDYLGVDGAYVQLEDLHIPKERFTAHDLTVHFSTPKKFDLAISLEVGEHLPEASASTLVKTLTNAADVVLFSAALPGQSGTCHINEQWPEYWAKKFLAQGFAPVDCIRKHIWHNERINVWYRQNIVLYVRKECLDTEPFSNLRSEATCTDADFLTRIHPQLFTYYVEKLATLSTFEGFARYKLAPFIGK